MRRSEHLAIITTQSKKQLHSKLTVRETSYLPPLSEQIITGAEVRHIQAKSQHVHIKRIACYVMSDTKTLCLNFSG